jgi:DNA polymerase epsilon subunit 1
MRQDFGIRSIIDWGYYKERLGKTIQKIITIPAAMQKVPNPVPRVQHPDWLDKKVRDLTEGYKQLKISNMFAKSTAADERAPSPASVADIEDTLNPSARGSTALVPKLAVVRRAGRAPDADDAAPSSQVEQPAEDAPSKQPEASESAKCPAITQDFQGWLRVRKAQWKQQRMERRRRRDLVMGSGRVGSRRGRDDAEGGGVGGAKKHMNVESMIKNAALAVTHGYWQILEIRETDIPGDFIIWAMTGPKSLQRLNLTIDRTLYVASDVEHDAAFVKLRGRRVSRFLPHGQRSPFLYEMITSERRFQRNENGVANLLSTPGVTGVFELQTPLWLRAVIQLGCVAQVSRQRRSQEGRSFNLADLEFVASTAHPYLAPDLASFRHIYIYQSQSGRRGVVGLFVLSADNKAMEAEGGPPPVRASAQVWLANPFSRAEARPPLQRIFGRYAPPGAECKFRSSYVDSLPDAFTQLNAALAEYLQSRRGPTLVLAQTTLVLSIMRRRVPLLNDFPVVIMPSNADDNRYPALGWQTYSAQRMVQRLLLMPTWLKERMSAARYGHIPLGNMGADLQRMMADVFFGWVGSPVCCSSCGKVTQP